MEEDPARKHAGQARGATFRVDLEGIELPEQTKKAIDADIRKVVMSHLAVIDFKGDLVFAQANGGGTWGIVGRLRA